jgi:hypothetical protein
VSTDPYLKVVLQSVPELLSLDGGRVVDSQVATLGDNLLGREGSLGVSPSRVLPPVLDGLDFLRKLAVFFLELTHGDFFRVEIQKVGDVIK